MITYKENTQGLKILTDQGYKDFSGIAYMGDKRVIRVEFAGGRFLECTDNHILFKHDRSEVKVSDLCFGDRIFADPDDLIVSGIVDTGRIEAVYDIIGVEGIERYYTNSVLSHNCRFVARDETLISGTVLEHLWGRDPLYTEGEIRFYQELNSDFAYLVGFDPSGGVNKDYAAIQVFQLPDFKQVAEWRASTTDMRGQVGMLLKILHRLFRKLKENPANSSDPQLYWTLENNGGYGDAAMMVINDTGIDLFPGEFIHEMKRRGGGKSFGLNTTHRSKLTACMKFKSLFESARIEVSSHALVREIKNFVAKGDSFAAKSGEHDDLVSAMLLVIRMVEIIQHWDEDFSDKLKETLDTEEMEIEPMPMAFLM